MKRSTKLDVGAAGLACLLLCWRALASEPSDGTVAPARTERAPVTSVRPDDASVTSLSGLTPNRAGPTELVFFRGWCADSSGKFRIIFANHATVRLDRIGPFGVDSEASHAAGELYPYVIGNSRTGAAAIVLSSQISNSKVARPREYDLIRKLRWGVILTDGQFPAFHFSGWGNPFTRLTEAGTTPRWQVLQRQSSDRFTAVSLRHLVPDNARLAYILVKADNTAATKPGSAFIRVAGSQGDGVQIGELPPGQVTYLPLHQRVTSLRDLYYRTTGDLKLDIWVLGYTNTEPS
jgi:hypothetical protein